MKPLCNSPPNAPSVLLDTDPIHVIYLFIYLVWLLCFEWTLHQFTSAADTGWTPQPPPTSMPPPNPCSEDSANVRSAGKRTTDHITTNLQSLHFLNLNGGIDVDANGLLTWKTNKPPY